MDWNVIYEPIADALSEVDERLTTLLTDTAAEAEPLARHVLRRPGKRLRPALVLLSGRACGPLTPQHVDLAAIAEMVHLASLIHDDVIDDADLRRRQPSVRARWGNHTAVLLGDFVFAKAQELLASLDSPSASALVARATSRMCEGEMRQLLRRFDPRVTEEDYLEIIDAKTAELFSVCCRLGAGASAAARQLTAALGQYGRALGMAFQIIDDCLDLTGDEAQVGKTLHTDLDTGKLTLPLIHVVRCEGPDAGELVFPAEGAASRAAIAEAIARHDAIAYSRDTARRYAQQARTRLRALPQTPVKRALLTLTEYAVDRDR